MILALASRRAAISPAWVKNPLWRAARAVPSLDLRFADTKSLADAATGQSLVTFTRASSGTYVGSDGLIKTAAVNEPRFDHNPTTGESLGLLVEEQKTNLLLNSATLSTQNVTVTAAAHTLSFTGTGSIALSGTSTAGPLVGTGTGEANRVSLTFTPTAGTLTLTVSGTVNNAQLELGSARTSYIPTTTAAATRSADVASITGANFSSWFNATQGTIYAQASTAESASNPYVAAINDGTNSNRLELRRIGASNLVSWIISTLGTTEAGPSVAGWTARTSGRLAAAYATNDVNLAFNGALGVRDTSANLPTVTQMVIGSTTATVGVNQPISRITYFPQRLSDSTLQALTQ